MSGSASDPHDLQRFVEAQNSGGTYAAALREIRIGRKTSHWMWFVFPQFAGLGHSPTARHYAIAGTAEARAYLAHPVLGPRLRECCAALLDVRHRTAQQIFGSIDELKLRSSATLFAIADPDELLFESVLDRYFGGVRDAATLRVLGVG